jgi:hypothetical protein
MNTLSELITKWEKSAVSLEEAVALINLLIAERRKKTWISAIIAAVKKLWASNV